MTTAADLRQISEAARPSIRAALDIAEELGAIRDAATAKGIDWSQLKSLLKAQEQDARDGMGEGKRVARILEKADYASSYADMLGLREDEREKEKPVHVPEPKTATVTSIAPRLASAQPVDVGDIPDFLDRRTTSA
jgi:hypothetical protein